MHANSLKLALFVLRTMKIKEFGDILTFFPSKTILTLYLLIFPRQLAICLTLWC